MFSTQLRYTSLSPVTLASPRGAAGLRSRAGRVVAPGQQQGDHAWKQHPRHCETPLQSGRDDPVSGQDGKGNGCATQGLRLVARRVLISHWGTMPDRDLPGIGRGTVAGPAEACGAVSGVGASRHEKNKDTGRKSRYISRDIPQCWPMLRVDRCPLPGFAWGTERWGRLAGLAPPQPHRIPGDTIRSLGCLLAPD